MSVQYFKSLFYKFSRVQTEIKKEQGRRFPNWARLLKLKKIRLAIKDRMMRINSKDSVFVDIRGIQPISVKVNSKTFK
jgi:uncharacterized protein YdcH (DUF465 family)